MPSEMRRAAKALVAQRVETFEVAEGAEAARERVERALAALGAPRALRYEGEWIQVDGRATYEARFAPAPRTPLVLNLISVAILLLIAGSVWAVVAGAQSLKFLLPMAAVLAIFAMPLVVAALGTRREAEESRIVRAIRAALAEAPAPR
jgi:hypothetical protein